MQSLVKQTLFFLIYRIKQTEEYEDKLLYKEVLEMKNIKVEYSWLKNSAITGVNQLPEHSEHYYFDKYVGINQLDYFQIDKIHLNNNWTYMKSDFNEKNGDDESTLVTLFNHFKGEDKLITKNIILKMQSLNLPVYIWMNGCFVGFSKGLEQTIEFEITNLLRLEENELIIKVCSIEEEKQNNNVMLDSTLDSILDKISESIIYSTPKLHVYDFNAVLGNSQNLNKSTLTINCLLNGYSNSAIISVYIYDKEKNIIFKENIDYTNKFEKRYDFDMNYLAISFVELLIIDDGTIVETAITKV